MTHFGFHGVWLWIGNGTRNHEQKLPLNTLHFYIKNGNKKQTIGGVYGHDGEILNKNETPAMYGGSLGYFVIIKPHDAHDIYQRKIKSMYKPDTGLWEKDLGYYDNNWVWFGLALYGNNLSNFFTK